MVIRAVSFQTWPRCREGEKGVKYRVKFDYAVRVASWRWRSCCFAISEHNVHTRHGEDGLLIKTRKPLTALRPRGCIMRNTRVTRFPRKNARNFKKNSIILTDDINSILEELEGLSK